MDRVHERGYFNQLCDNWKFDWRGNQIRKENEDLRERERERERERPSQFDGGTEGTWG